uniref:DUF3352 domain-containing protein n=1 Tax=Cyanothece sp. (strain PCC 7425 / ATCC 29141) TaxID=395961 RepID=B8HQ17_CYAP4
MDLRKFFKSLAAMAIGIMLLVIASGCSAKLPQGRVATPAAAMFIPRQAPLVFSLLVNPQQLPPLTQSGQRQTSLDAKQLLQSLLAKFGVDYNKEVQPWLGEEVTLSLTTLDLDRQPQNGQQPGYLFALAVDQPERGREFLQKFWERQTLAGTKLSQERYQGVQLTATIASQPPLTPARKSKKGKAVPLPSLATALVGNDFVLLANDPRVLRNAINNVQAADLGLAEADFYQQALASLDQKRIGLVFANLPELSQWHRQPAATSSQEPSPPTYDRLVASLSLDPQGLVLDTALVAAPGVELPVGAPTLDHVPETLQSLPANTALALTGTDLSQTWARLNQSLQGYNVLANLIKQPLITAQHRWNLDLPADIFAWVEGEYSLGLIPVQRSTQLDWLFAVEDQEQVEQGIAHLDQLAVQQGFSTGNLSVQQQDLVAWTKLQTAPAPVPASKARTTSQPSPSPLLSAEVVGVHRHQGDRTLLASSLTALEPTASPLATDPDFKQAIAPLDLPNQGYVYLNWPQLRPWLEERFPLLQTVETLASPLFDHLKSLSLTSYSAQEPIQRNRIYVRLS